jgi:hypothetical protein
MAGPVATIFFTSDNARQLRRAYGLLLVAAIRLRVDDL